MGYGKLLLFVGALGLAAHFWNGHKQASVLSGQVDESGFVETVNVDGAIPNTVLILAPPNCPSEQAQRAEALSRRLTQMGIPHVMGSGFSISLADPTADERAGIDRAVAVFQRGAPAVFINGMAKSNPTAEEVAVEYKRTRAKG